MKTLILILFTLLNTVARSAETKAERPEKSEVYGDVVVNDSLKKILDIKGVMPIYQDCKSRFTKVEEIPDCIWQEVSKKPDLKKLVMDTYKEEIKGSGEGRSPASDKNKLTARENNVSINHESDPAVEALSKFYGEKLDQILDPDKGLTAEERKAGKILTVDHSKFIELYKSELGKTIINAFTSYCLDTDSSTCCTAANYQDCGQTMCTIRGTEQEQKDDRKTNLAALSSLDLSGESADAKKWTRCISDVPKVCEKSTSKESKKRACLIVDYVKAARKNIMIADEQKAFYKEITYNNHFNLATNTKIITDEEKASADALLNLTSKDVKDSLGKTTEKNLKEIDECHDLNTDAIMNIEACKKFLNTNKEGNEAAVADFGLRQYAQEENLKTELASSPERVRDYLKEEGYSDDEIKKMTENKESIEKIREQILSRFKNEKEAIIKEMADKITNKTSVTDGKIEAQEAGNQSKITQIREDIQNRSSDLANLVQFNNIVSSYLSIDDNKGKVERNTASLFAESKTMDETSAKAIQQQIKAADLKDQKNSADLNVDTINKAFLKYDVEPKK